MKMPQKSKISPPIERTEAVISCVFGAICVVCFSVVYWGPLSKLTKRLLWGERSVRREFI